MCDLSAINPVYEGVRAKESPEVNKMTKTLIAAAAMIALLTGAANNMAVQNNETADTVGRWTEKEETSIDAEAQEIFDQATGELIGVDYTAVELLETQLVSGMNYKFLAEAKTVYPGAESRKVIVTVYRDLAGNVSILDIENL